MQFRFAAAFAALLITAPALAQHETDEHLRLATVITDEALNEASFEIVMKVGFEGVLRSETAMIEMEDECPGMIGAITDGVRPLMWEMFQQDNLEYRAALYKLLSGKVTSEQAHGAANFFASPLGQRFIYTLNNGLSADNMVSDVLTSEDLTVSREAMQKDLATSAMRGIFALSAEDRAEVLRVFSSEDWARAFAAIQPSVVDLQHKLSNQPDTPEENARIDLAVEQATIAHYEKCYTE